MRWNGSTSDYGYFATSIAGAFFPNSNPLCPCCSPWLVWFVLRGRPVGAVILGAYADRAGRKAASRFHPADGHRHRSHALMPSYATVELIAPICVFAARLLQGSPWRGVRQLDRLYDRALSPSQGVLCQLSVCRSTRGKGAFGALRSWLTTTLSTHQLHTWDGGSVSFGLLVGPVGLYIRRK